MIKALIAWTGGAIFIYVLLIALMYFGQRSMIYFTRSSLAPIEDTAVTGIRAITATTSDGLELIGWYRPAVNGRPTILWLHENASDVSITVQRARPYLDAGFGLLAAEYRGYAGNPGRPTEQGLYIDVQAFVTWLEQSGVQKNDIVLYGESIGTGPATQIASEDAAFHTLVLESPFTSLVDAAAYHYPFAPVRWLMRDQFANIDKIAAVKSPVIVAYGTNDTIVPSYMGQEVFETAPEPKSRIVIPDGGHNTLDQFGLAAKIISLLSE